MAKVFVFASHDTNDDPGVVTLRVLLHPGGVHPDEYVRAEGSAFATLLQHLGVTESAAAEMCAKAAADEGFQFEATLEGWHRVQAWITEENSKH